MKPYAGNGTSNLLWIDRLIYSILFILDVSKVFSIIRLTTRTRLTAMPDDSAQNRSYRETLLKGFFRVVTSDWDMHLLYTAEINYPCSGYLSTPFSELN